MCCQNARVSKMNRKQSRSIFERLRSELDVAMDEGNRSCFEESERALLVALSKVRRLLQSHPHDDTGSINLDVACGEPNDGDNNLIEDKEGRSPSQELQGLSNTLVSILASENDFVGHSAGKTLSALSHYTSSWPLILHILWNASMAWCRDSGKNVSEKLGTSDSEVSTAVYLAGNDDPHAAKRNWTAALRAIQVLHNILKNVKQECPSKLNTFLNVTGIYIEVVISAFITNILPSDNVSENFCKPKRALYPPPTSTINDKSNHAYGEKLLRGALLRFLCSIVQCMSLHSEKLKAADFMSQSQILTSIESFMPALASLCLVPHNDSCVSHFLRHKFLMLLFRLSEWFTEKPSLAVMCWEILKSHAGDLFESLFQRRSQSGSPLLGSPFAISLAQTSNLKQTVLVPINQLQRRAFFLVFKVFVSLRKVADQSNNEIGKTSFISDAIQGDTLISLQASSKEEQCATQVGQWLVDWLLVQIDLVADISSFEFIEVADGLASSFVQLFVDEDVLMLEILLLLLDFPMLVPISTLSGVAGKSSRRAQDLLVAVMNPLRLFSAFLSMVQYDHSVIVDYLISIDTSTLCLQYLLRCLRTIQNTWPEFLSLSSIYSDKQLKKDSSCGLEADKQVQVESTSELVQSLATKRQRKSSYVYDANIDVKNTASCLLLLKLAVERLHRKHVFPYNPSVLLRRLELFQQLWQR